MSALEPKRFELPRTLLPQASLVGVLVNPDNPNAENHAKGLRAAASPSGLRMLILEARNIADMEKALATLAQQRAAAVASADQGGKHHLIGRQGNRWHNEGVFIIGLAQVPNHRNGFKPLDRANV